MWTRSRWLAAAECPPAPPSSVRPRRACAIAEDSDAVVSVSRKRGRGTGEESSGNKAGNKRRKVGSVDPPHHPHHPAVIGQSSATYFVAPTAPITRSHTKPPTTAPVAHAGPTTRLQSAKAASSACTGHPDHHCPANKQQQSGRRALCCVCNIAPATWSRIVSKTRHATIPSGFVLERSAPLWCKDCKTTDACPTLGAVCVVCCVKRAHNKLDGTTYLWCSACKPDGAFDGDTKRCESCPHSKRHEHKAMASYCDPADPSRRRRWCKTCAPEGSVSALKRPCQRCSASTYVQVVRLKLEDGSVREELLCRSCELGRCITRFKVKEERVVTSLRRWLQDPAVQAHNVSMQVNTSVRDAVTSTIRYPDIQLTAYGRVLVVEVDEYQHKGYDWADEVGRMHQIARVLVDTKSVRAPVQFVRFNPDGYKPAVGQTVVPIGRRLEGLRTRLMDVLNTWQQMDATASGKVASRKRGGRRGVTAAAATAVGVGTGTRAGGSAVLAPNVQAEYMFYEHYAAPSWLFGAAAMVTA